ncbi:hypothetical protein AB0I08_42160, partial [Streptomyces lavendulae]
VQWRRRHPDFPTPVGGTDVHPEFDRAAVLAWLLAHDKIAVPTKPANASLLFARPGGGTRALRLDDPLLTLAEDASGEDRLSAWSTEADADALATLADGEFGATLRRLTVPGSGVWAVLGEVRVLDRFRPGAGGLHVTLAWPARLRGAADGPAGGAVRHGVPDVRTGQECVCVRHDCGGLVPKSWCTEHGDAVGPVLEWHVGGGLHCARLAQDRAVRV